MKIFTFLLALVTLVLVSGGCDKAVHDKIERALMATNVTFYRNVGSEIPLSDVQSRKVKDVVRAFKDRSRVTVENDVMGFEDGGFRLGDETFSWQGGTLCFRDQR